MHRRRVLLVALMVLAAACGKKATGGTTSGGGGDGVKQALKIAGHDANNHGSEDVTAGGTVALEQQNYFFSPTILTGDAGETLTIEVTNAGTVPHTFTINGQVDDELQPGDTKQIDVTFPTSGALLFFCRFHASSGMRGGLSVGGSLAKAPGSSGDSGGSGGGGGGYGGSGGGGYGGSDGGMGGDGY